MSVPFKIIKQEPESIYDRKVTLEMSEADLIMLQRMACNYIALDGVGDAARRFYNGDVPEGFYNLDFNKLFGGI